MTPIRQEVKWVLELSKSQEKLYEEKGSRRTPLGYEYSRNMTVSPFINPHLQRTTGTIKPVSEVPWSTTPAVDKPAPGGLIQTQLSCHHTAEEAPRCQLKASATSFRPIDTPVSTRLPLKLTCALKTPFPTIKVQSHPDTVPSTTTIRLISPPRVITQKELLQSGAPKFQLTTLEFSPSPKSRHRVVVP